MNLGAIRIMPLKGITVKFLIFIIALAASFTVLGKNIKVEPFTPIYDSATANAKVIAVFQDSTELPLTGNYKRVFIARHPLAKYTLFYPVRLEDGRNAYVAPDIRLKDENGKMKMFSVGYQPWWRTCWLVVALTGLVIFLFLQIRNLYELRAAKSCSAREAWYWVVILILLRHVMLLALLICGNDIVCSASDDPGYFLVAKDLLSGKIDGPWSYPIGHGVLFFIPAIILTGAEEFYDLSVQFAYFSGFVLAPLTLVMGFQLLRKIGFGARYAFAAVLLLTLMPFFMAWEPSWEQKIFTSAIVTFPPSSAFGYYNSLIGSGFNAMSDTPSNFMLVGTLLLIMTLPPKLFSTAIASALLALCCMTRLNNVLFLPAAGYMLFNCNRQRLSDLRYLVLSVVVGAGVFFLVFLPQFLINWHQFGSPLTFSYVLHGAGLQQLERPDAGFTFHTLLQWVHLRFLANSNFVVWVGAISGMLIMKNRFQRNLLVLWAIPVLIFFAGYSHTFCDAVRFVISSYLPLLAAFACCDVWRELARRERLLLGGFLAVSVIFSTPFMIWEAYLTPLSLKSPQLQIFFMLFLPLAGALLIWWMLKKKQRRAAIFLTVFLILYGLGNAFALGLLMLLILCRSLYSVILEISTLRPRRFGI